MWSWGEEEERVKGKGAEGRELARARDSDLKELQLCFLSWQSMLLPVHVREPAGEALSAKLLYHLVCSGGGQVRSGQSAAQLVAHSGGHVVLQSEVCPLKVAVSLLCLQR